MITNIFDQVNVEGLIRAVGMEKATRLLKQMMNNNLKILELQKQSVILQKKNMEKKKKEVGKKMKENRI